MRAVHDSVGQILQHMRLMWGGGGGGYVLAFVEVDIVVNRQPGGNVRGME